MISEIKQEKENENENLHPSLVDANNNNELLGGPRKRERWLVKHNEPKPTPTTSTGSRLQLPLPELPSEIWVEIMWKLPIKPLHVCKCVSKTWHSYVSHILTTQKGIHLPPCGLLFEIMHCPDDNPDANYLAFLSLAGDNKLTKWFVDNGSQSESAATITMSSDLSQNGGSGRLLLGSLTLAFSTLMGVISGKFPSWSMHKGLILAIPDVHTYLVYNPATKEAFSLSTPVARVSTRVAIINLSDCPLSTECNFRVVHFVKTKAKGIVSVHVYSSNKREWCVSKFRLKKVAIQEGWGGVMSGVFVNNTLFFLTDKRHAIRVQFHSSGQVSSVYSLRLPHRITWGYCQSRLDGSQGCLYLSYHEFPNLWIWKHSGSSTHSDAWIPQLIFKESGISLCQPVIESFLRQSVADFSDIDPMIIHPEAPVVFIFAHRSIFAIHLLKDTVEKIVEMNEGEEPSVGTVKMYSPCFTSFKCLKPANQDHCK